MADHITFSAWFLCWVDQALQTVTSRGEMSCLGKSSRKSSDPSVFGILMRVSFCREEEEK